MIVLNFEFCTDGVSLFGVNWLLESKKTFGHKLSYSKARLKIFEKFDTGTKIMRAVAEPTAKANKFVFV